MKGHLGSQAIPNSVVHDQQRSSPSCGIELAASGAQSYGLAPAGGEDGPRQAQTSVTSPGVPSPASQAPPTAPTGSVETDTLLFQKYRELAQRHLKGLPALFFRLGSDHLPEEEQRLLGMLAIEHVLGAEQADAFGSELPGPQRILGVLGIGPNPEAPE